MNENAIQLLEKNPDKIDWHMLSANENAIKLLEQNPDKIDWFELSLNKNAIRLLEQNPDNIDWYGLSQNPKAVNIFSRYDYNKMTENNRVPAEDLISTVMNPKRTRRMADTHGMTMSKYVDNFSNVPDDYGSDDYDSDASDDDKDGKRKRRDT
jgi:hypothetical protein